VPFRSPIRSKKNGSIRRPIDAASSLNSFPIKPSERSSELHFLPLALVQRCLQLGPDLDNFDIVGACFQLRTQFLDMLLDRHHRLLILAKDKGVARGGAGRVKDREAAAPAAMGVPILSGP